jgi:S1-C subfamily serine protease
MHRVTIAIFSLLAAGAALAQSVTQDMQVRPPVAPTSRPPAAAPAPGATPAPASDDPSFRLANVGTNALRELYVYRAGTSERGPNRLSAPVAGGSNIWVNLQTLRGSGCQFDVDVIFEGGGTEGLRNENLCLLFRLTSGGTAAGGGLAPVAGSPGTPTPGATTPAQVATPPAAAPASNAPASLIITIRNDGRSAIREIKASLTTDTGFGPNRLDEGEEVLPGATYQLRLPRVQGCQWDIQVVFRRGGPQNFMGRDLCTDTTLAFRGPAAGQEISGGTGFYVSETGHIVTNRHVIEGCGSVGIGRPGAPSPRLLIVAEDAQNDLALLLLPNARTAAVRFRALDRPLRAGDTVLLVGYPLTSLLGGVNITSGMMSAVAGNRGDPNRFQLSAPAQPGNSGGPVFDESGHVVGVLVAGIDSSGGRIMQNINFAIQAAATRRFIAAHGVNPVMGTPTPALHPADLYDRALPLVVPLICFS